MRFALLVLVSVAVVVPERVHGQTSSSVSTLRPGELAQIRSRIKGQRRVRVLADGGPRLIEFPTVTRRGLFNSDSDARDTVDLLAIQRIETWNNPAPEVALGVGLGAGTVAFAVSLIMNSQVDLPRTCGGFFAPGGVCGGGATVPVGKALTAGAVSAVIGAAVGWIIGDRMKGWKVVYTAR